MQIRLRHRHRQGTWTAEGDGTDQRSQPKTLGVARETRDGGPGVGRPGQLLLAHQVVVGEKEAMKPEPFDRLGQRHQIVVRCAELRLDIDDQLHPSTLSICAGV